MSDNKRASPIINLYNNHYLYIGSKYDAKNKSWLKENQIKYILNCTPPRTVDSVSGCPNYHQNDPYFKYQRIPIFDNSGEDIQKYFEVVFRFIEEGKHYGSVLVHCHKGISRSASFVIAYLMKSLDFTRDEALNHVVSCRSIIQPNETFLSQLTVYQRILSENKESDNVTTNSSSSLEASHIVSTVGPTGPPIHQVEVAQINHSNVIHQLSDEVVNDSGSQSSNVILKPVIDSNTLKSSSSVDVDDEKHEPEEHIVVNEVNDNVVLGKRSLESSESFEIRKELKS